MREKRLRVFEYIVLVDLSLFIILAPFSSLASKVFIYSSTLLWILFCLWEYHSKFYRHLVAPNVLNKDFRLFFLVLLIATRFSLDCYHSQGIFFARYLGFTIAFLLGSAVAQERSRVYFLMGAVIIASIMIGLGGLWDHWHLPSGSRLFTSFGRDVNLSAMLALYFPFVCILALFAQGRFLKWGGLISTSILFPSFIWNMSRAVWIAVPLSILVVVYMTQRKKLALVLGIFFVISFVFFPANLKVRMAQTFKQDSRIEMSKAAIGMFEDFPVFGAGLGMYEKLVAIYSPESRYTYIHPDNTFTEILAETGMIGLTVFLWLFNVFFRKAYELLKAGTGMNRGMFAIRLGLTGAMMSSLIVSFATNSVTVGFQNAVVFWLILGIASGLLTSVISVMPANLSSRTRGAGIQEL